MAAAVAGGEQRLLPGIFNPAACWRCPHTPTYCRRADLSVEAFRQQYELPNRPVVLTDAAAAWPAAATWDRSYLLAALGGDAEVIVGNMPMPLAQYLAYAEDNTDEMPLYLFVSGGLLRGAALACVSV